KQVAWARDTAASLLMPLGRRWMHTLGVLERARSLVDFLPAATSCSSACAASRVGEALSLDDAVADELELDKAPELHELRDALLVAERGDHAREVADGGDGGSDAAAERLPVGGAAEVVVPARAGGLGHELQL